MLLTYYLILFVVSITRRERHQDGETALSTNVVDVFSHITAIGIDSLLFASLFDGYIQRIIAHARNAGTSTAFIIRPIVVMTYRDDDPVARTDGLTDGFP